MKYIIIDGDDIGKIITQAYLTNNLHGLIKINDLVRNKTNQIAELLQALGFSIIFCAADGVAGSCASPDVQSDESIFNLIEQLSGELSFSAGVGSSLRESYIALLSAKSSGKACIKNFSQM